MMLDISGDPKFWSDATYIGCTVVSGVAAWIATRKGAADKAAQPVNPVQPVGSATTAVTYVVEADLIRDMLVEARAQHADMIRWREEDDERRSEEERNGLLAKVRDLERQNGDLKRGQGRTHGKQDEIVDRLDELMKRLDNMEARAAEDTPDR